MPPPNEPCPVLVAYNIPFRAAPSSRREGQRNVAEYKSWIDGFAAGIGERRAIVILEPDGLGIIPGTTRTAPPKGRTPSNGASRRRLIRATAASDRFDMLRYAVDTLAGHPAVATNLDRHAQRRLSATSPNV